MKTYHYKLKAELVIRVRASDEVELREELEEILDKGNERLKEGFPIKVYFSGYRQEVNVLPQELPDPFLIEEEGDNTSLDILEDESLEEREVL